MGRIHHDLKASLGTLIVPYDHLDKKHKLVKESISAISHIWMETNHKNQLDYLKA